MIKALHDILHYFHFVFLEMVDSILHYVFIFKFDVLATFHSTAQSPLIKTLIFPSNGQLIAKLIG